jgi:hypothetical protein
MSNTLIDYCGFVDNHPFYVQNFLADKSDQIHDKIQRVVISTPLDGRVTFEIDKRSTTLIHLHIDLSNLKELSKDKSQLNANNTKIRDLLNSFFNQLQYGPSRSLYHVRSIDLSNNIVSGRSLLMMNADYHYLLDENILFRLNTVNFNDTQLSGTGIGRFGAVPNIQSLHDGMIEFDY